MARGALLDNSFGKCSYYRSQHAMLLIFTQLRLNVDH